MALDIEQAKRDGAMYTNSKGWKQYAEIIHIDLRNVWIRTRGGRDEVVSISQLSNLPPKTRRVRVPVTMLFNGGGGLVSIHRGHAASKKEINNSGYVGVRSWLSIELTDIQVSHLMVYGLAVEELPAEEPPSRKLKTRHDGDCTIYASLVNGNPNDGICTCGYAHDCAAGDADVYQQHMYSEERVKAISQCDHQADRLQPHQIKRIDKIIQDMSYVGIEKPYTLNSLINLIWVMETSIECAGTDSDLAVAKARQEGIEEAVKWFDFYDNARNTPTSSDSDTARRDLLGDTEKEGE